MSIKDGKEEYRKCIYYTSIEKYNLSSLPQNCNTLITWGVFYPLKMLRFTLFIDQKQQYPHLVLQ